MNSIQSMYSVEIGQERERNLTWGSKSGNGRERWGRKGGGSSGYPWTETKARRREESGSGPQSGRRVKSHQWSLRVGGRSCVRWKWLSLWGLHKFNINCQRRKQSAQSNTTMYFLSCPTNPQPSLLFFSSFLAYQISSFVCVRVIWCVSFFNEDLCNKN